MSKMDLSFYLSRPTRIQSGALQTTDSATAFTALAMPQAMLKLPIFADKPRGRYGFRATMVFRLVVNAERFQQGRYMLTYVPLGGARYGTTEQKGNRWVNTHSATLRQRSMLPHVEFDLNCDSEAILRIPYASEHDFYTFSWANTTSSGPGTWGVLRLFPYSPLVTSAGSTTADYTIYGHFEDVEFVGFSQDSIVPQSDSPFTSIVKKKGSASQAEAKISGVGPLQSASMSVAKAAAYLMPIPMLSNFASTVGWAANITANVASVFGWSAPLNVEKSTRMNITNYAYYNNVNKIDNSIPMAFTTDNEVGVASGFSSTNKDELDITSFAMRPAWFRTISWPDSAVVGNELTAITISPDSYKSTIAYNTLNYISHTPLSFTQSQFKKWRGSVTFKIKIVKTEFHSGRLALAWFPSSGSSRSLDNSDYVHRDIVDIRESSEIAITIPYCHSDTYLDSSFTDNGVLSIFVVDRLVAPDNVSNSVTLLIEVAGGPDIEFATPVRMVNYTPARDFVVQSANPFGEDADCATISKVIGAANTPQFQLDTSQLCIGERILSFRQIIKRFTPIGTPVFTPNKFLYIFPFATVTAATTASVDSLPISGDLYSVMASIFMFSRGGVRFKIFPRVTDATAIVTTLSQATFNGASTEMIGTQTSSSVTGSASETENIIGRACYTLSDISIVKVVEVDIPQYYKNKSRNNAENSLSASNTLSNANSADLVLNIFGFEGVSTRPDITNPQILRAGSDDCNFGLFVSIPPMTVNPTT